MAKRSIRVPWLNIQTMLNGLEQLLPSEEIREITLVKPRTLLVHLERPDQKHKEE